MGISWPGLVAARFSDRERERTELRALLVCANTIHGRRIFLWRLEIF